MKNIQSSGCPVPRYTITRASTRLNLDPGAHTDVLRNAVRLLSVSLLSMLSWNKIIADTSLE